jgi:hypothetical protein
MNKTDGLSNSEIFKRYTDKTRRNTLTQIQRQVGFVMAQHLRRQPCPNCGTPHSVPEAAGVAVDEYDFAASTSDRVGPCHSCKRTLLYVLPLDGGWRWCLDYNEASKEKAGQ